MKGEVYKCLEKLNKCVRDHRDESGRDYGGEISFLEGYIEATRHTLAELLPALEAFYKRIVEDFIDNSTK